MAEHRAFSGETGVTVYFCTPRSPWQRGTNENTNRLLRQYLAKSADLRRLSQDDLDAIALELNGRPRRLHGFRSPAEVYAGLLQDSGALIS
jgi:IS30 family transposase